MRRLLGKGLPPSPSPRSSACFPRSQVRFPSSSSCASHFRSETFRCLSTRKDLLLGVLGAKVFTFQQTNYAKHWRQTVRQTLCYEALASGVQVPKDEGLTLSAMQEMEHIARDGVNLKENKRRRGEGTVPGCG